MNLSIFSPFGSRIGLDWACTVADILHRLNACPMWSTVIAAFADHCVNQLPQTLKRTNLFTLLVLVGFPQVRSTEVIIVNERRKLQLKKTFSLTKIKENHISKK